MPYGLPAADNATLEVFGGKLRVKDFGLDATKLAQAAAQTVSAGFVATHNNKSVLLLSCDSADRTSGAPHIQAGVKAGQELTIVVTDDANGIIITDGGGTGTQLNGRWYVGDSYGIGAWLKVVWDGTRWWEVGRGSGELVASGCHAHAEGSVGNTASGYSSHAEGRSNTASGSNSHAENLSNIASGSESHCEGYSSVANGAQSHCEGYDCQASGAYSHAEGKNCTASGSYSHAQGGWCTAYGVYSFAMGKYGYAARQFQLAHGGDMFTSAGDAQYSRDILRREVTHSDATHYVIGNDDSSTGPILPVDTAWTFEAQVIGVTADCGKIFSYLVNGCIKNVGGTVTLLASNVTTIYEDTGTFDCEVVANATSDSLSIRVWDTGSGGDTVRWVATLQLTQITFAS